VGGGQYSSVELQEREHVLYEDEAGWRAAWLRRAWGRLYLTNQRLIWARGHPQLPLIRQPVLIISLRDIMGTDMKVPLFGGYYYLLVRTQERTYSFGFQPASLKADVEEWRHMIEKARGSYEIPG
jgi:hypothetical protein